MAPRRTAGLAVAAIGLGLLLAGFVLRPRLERAVASRVESEASRHGLAARVASVRLGLWPPLRLAGVVVEPKPAGTEGSVTRARFRLSAASVEGWWRGRPRLVVRDALLEGPGGTTLAARATSWDIRRGDPGTWRLALVEPQHGLTLDQAAGAGETRWTAEATDLPLDSVFDLRQSDRPLVREGTARGRIHIVQVESGLRFDADLALSGVRLPALGAVAMGEPADVALRAAGTWNRTAGTLDVPQLEAVLDGARLSGRLALRDLGREAAIDLTLGADRVDFGRVLRTAGLGAPEKLGGAASDDLGVATIAASAQGRLADPGSFVVSQQVEFTPPARLPEAITRLRGPFVHQATGASGAVRSIEVSPASPDFIPLADVPPLFVRALLLAEDAGFYGHPGFDLREMPAAILTDIDRGGAARGASTITQQLAKNLFLSPEKALGRKLQELSCALLLEAALGKNRILEIYLNVIEWGPDLYGLRPAARTYFDREPGELTPAQVAFLVSLIPGPVKYQVSFAHGTLGPGMRQLVDALLAKLRSVDALTEEDYRAALAEEIVVRNVRPEPARTSLE
jgi:hypothetical protein